jgi:hypothetical protein
MGNTEFGHAARAIAVAALAVKNTRYEAPDSELTGSIDRHVPAIRGFREIHASASVRRDRLLRNCTAWRMTTELSLPSRQTLGRIAADIATDAEWLGTNY